MIYKILRKSVQLMLLLAAFHIVLIARLLWMVDELPHFVTIMLLLFLCVWYCIHQITGFDKRESDTRRLRIMMKGRNLCYKASIGFCSLLIYVLYAQQLINAVSVQWFWISIIAAVCLMFIVWINGVIRVFLTSKRLRVRLRLLMVLCMWIPMINLFVLFYALHKVKQEYEFDTYKQGVKDIRKESDLCETAYPLLLVHGIGFRDLRYFNYWGRIPRELTRYGAVVYYGHQEALGTIVNNAQQIKDKILEIVNETGSDKVNIIAHSKGGLDARYAISKLGMAPYVASLTTLSTPHRGCRMVDVACKLPDGLYRLIAKCFDSAFSRFGDQHPDFYTATHQFSTGESAIFNEQVQNVEGIYYQSYATKMRGTFSDPLLWIPYTLIKHLEGENDGLVAIPSAKWGIFQGVVESKGYRGISHGDIIDLKREDYQGFDVIEWFVQVIADLKQRGY